MQRAVNPSPFNIEASIEYLLMAVVGGAGHVWGALLGAGIVTVIKDQLQNILPTSPQGLWPLLAAPFRRLARASRRPLPAGEALPRRTLPTRGSPLLDVK